MDKYFTLKYSVLFVLILLLSSCKILKKKKDCDCPEWSYNLDNYKTKLIGLKKHFSQKEKYFT